jgi:protein-arginine kinase activator protein McsA
VSIQTTKILRRHLLGMAAALQEEIEKEEQEKATEKRDPAPREKTESSTRSL